MQGVVVAVSSVNILAALSTNPPPVITATATSLINTNGTTQNTFPLVIGPSSIVPVSAANLITATQEPTQTSQIYQDVDRETSSYPILTDPATSDATVTALATGSGGENSTFFIPNVGLRSSTRASATTTSTLRTSNGANGKLIIRQLFAFLPEWMLLAATVIF